MPAEYYLSQFLTIAAVHFLAVASPGPDLAIVVRHSVVYGRWTAICTSLGVGAGIFLHTGYSLLGIGLIIFKSVALFNFMKIIAVLYLLYLGFTALCSKPMNQAEIMKQKDKSPSSLQAMRTGFFTNALNPKVTLFFLSLFTVVIDPGTPLSIQAGYGLYMAVATAIWFSGLSFLFGHDAVRRKFLKIGHWFDRLIGVALIGLSLKLAFTGRN